MAPTKTPSSDWDHVNILARMGGGSCEAVCKYCGTKWMSINLTRLRAHLMQDGKGAGVANCKNVPIHVLSQLRGTKRQKSAAAFYGNSGAGSSFSAGESSGQRSTQQQNSMPFPSTNNSITPCSTQKTLDDFIGDQTKKEADAAVARVLYTSGIPFNVMNNPYFREMCLAIAACGLHSAGVYEPPSFHDVRTKLLGEEVKAVKSDLQTLRYQLGVYGATITMDGWTNITGHSLYNVMLVSPCGSEFLFAEDTSGHSKTGAYLAGILERGIKEVGAENVMQVCMDNASNCKLAGEMIHSKFPKITSAPCAAHSINLIFTDMGAEKWIADLVEKGNKIQKFATLHGTARDVLKKYTKLKLVKPVATRFGTNFLMLERLYTVRTQLGQCTTDPDWKTEYVHKALYRELAGEFTELVMNESFWTEVEGLLNVMKPIFVQLRLFDGNTAAIGKVYYGMSEMVRKVRELTCRPQAQIKRIADICEKRWNMLHTRLHAAGYVLEPEHRSDSWYKIKEVMTGFRDVVVTLFDDAHFRACNVEIKSWQEFAMTDEDELECRKTPSYLWWRYSGSAWPHLQEVAMRVLSQVTSASACERNWSNFGFIHNKSRNRLQVERATDLVYVYANRRLLNHAENTSRAYIRWGDEDETPETIGVASEVLMAD
jgi:Protein of unknown function (DUF 659)/hAT family C-terminal dimerisation region